MCTRHNMRVSIRGQVTGVTSFVLACGSGSRGSNSGCQTWRQAPLAPEPSHQPRDCNCDRWYSAFVKTHWTLLQQRMNFNICKLKSHLEISGWSKDGDKAIQLYYKYMKQRPWAGGCQRKRMTWVTLDANGICEPSDKRSCSWVSLLDRAASHGGMGMSDFDGCKHLYFGIEQLSQCGT